MAESTASRGSLFRRLYRGDSNINFIGSRKRWYTASAIIIADLPRRASSSAASATASTSRAATSSSVPIKAGTSLSQIEKAVSDQGVEVAQGQTAGSSTSSTYIIETKRLDSDTQNAVMTAVAKAADTTVDKVSFTFVSDSWGGSVSRQAIEALIVFLIAVSAFIAIRFRDWRMAAAALAALIHDLILTAGVYSLVGFEVTPSTVVGLLTILGFSLYDTVVVFDKVDENSRGILAASRYTYAEAANNRRQPDAHALDQHLDHRSAAGRRPAVRRRRHPRCRHAGRPGPGAVRRHAHRCVLVAVPRDAVAGRPQDARPALQEPRRPDPVAPLAGRDRGWRQRGASGPEGSACPSGDRERSPVPSIDDEAFAGAVTPRVGAKPAARSGSTNSGKRSGARPSANRPGGGAKRR